MKVHSIENHQDTLAAADMNRLPASFLEVMRRMEDGDERIYLTGQAARDLLLGQENPARRGIELISTLPAKEVRERIDSWNDFSTLDSERNPDEILVIPREGNDPTSAPRIRISSMRRTNPSYRWFQENTMEGIVLDLATREITIQAFAIERSGDIVDPFGGVADLRARVIQTIIPDIQVFREGTFWHLKIAKYVGYYGFDVSPTLMKYAQRDAGNILDGRANQWKNHLDKILLSYHVDRALDFLYNSKVLQLILPEVKAMVGFHESCAVHHKDLWDHTKQVIQQSSRHLPVRWAALMHDIGKIETRTVNAQGKVHFFRHEALGALLFRGIAHRLEMDREEEERIHYIILHHSRVNLYHPSWSDGAVRRLLRDCAEHLSDLIMFSKADFTTKRQSRIDELKRHLQEFEERIVRIRQEDARVPPLPKGLGSLIMTRFALNPGRRIGEIRDWLEAEAEAGRIEPGEPGEYYLQYLEEHRDELGLPPVSSAEEPVTTIESTPA